MEVITLDENNAPMHVRDGDGRRRSEESILVAMLLIMYGVTVMESDVPRVRFRYRSH